MYSLAQSRPKIEAVDRMVISKYLIETVKAYHKGRIVLIGQGSTLGITCGVSHGSKMGSLSTETEGQHSGGVNDHLAN